MVDPKAFFEALGVRLYRRGCRFVGKCPIHDSRSPEALNFYPDKGNWVCNSDKCHKKFPRSAIGFIRGVLSNQQCGWQQEGDDKVSHKEAVDWALDFLNTSIHNIKVDYAKADKIKFIDEFNKPELIQPTLCTIDEYLNMVEIPAQYYLDRGYPEWILKKYEVGQIKGGILPKNRIAYPVYDDNKKRILGAVTRSLLPRCPQCRNCHNEEFPCSSGELRWKIIGLNDKHHLYNYWYAKQAISETKSLVIVEGAGDVWRMVEAGCRNVVGLFGSNLYPMQESLIQSCGARTIYVASDNDEAGRSCREEIKRKCGTYMKVVSVEYAGQEIGDLDVNYIKNEILPKCS